MPATADDDGADDDGAAGAEAGGGVAASRRGTGSRALARELVSLPTVVLVLALLLIGIPLVVLLTPDQRIEVVSQQVSVGARDPAPDWSGPARIVQVGNTAFDLRGVEVVGPLRPQLSLGPIRRSQVPDSALDPAELAAMEASAVGAVVRGFARWYLWGTLGVVLVALVTSGAVGCLRVLLRLRRESRGGGPHRSVGELASETAGTMARMTLIALVTTLAAWGASGVAAYRGTVDGLAGVASLSDLVGATTVTPAPVGPPVYGYRGAVVSDSRVARLGGPVPAGATPEDAACSRSTDSAAAELAMLRGTRVLNLACAGAGIATGLRGPQVREGAVVPPQIGRLRQVEGLDWVVVATGPNDVEWSDFLLYCYRLPTCDDRLVGAEFDRRLTEFDGRYAALLADLATLPDAPRVVVMTSYRVFPDAPDPGCPDLVGPPGTAGLDQAAVTLLAQRNTRLNEVLENGAQEYGFAVASSRLTPLCADAGDGMGPDLQGLGDPYPFHPTAVGSLRTAAALAEAVALAGAAAPPE